MNINIEKRKRHLGARKCFALDAIGKKFKGFQIVITVICITMLASNSYASGVNLNYCEAILEDTFVPAVFEEVLSCDVSGLACLGAPHCCLPGGCFTDPACYSISKTQKVAAYWKYKDEIYCDGSKINPEELVDRWLKGEIAAIANIAAGMLPDLAMEFLYILIEELASEGKHLPQSVQSVMEEMIEPVYDQGKTGYAHIDIKNIKVLKKSHNYWTDLFVKKGGITLGPVVILKDKHYDELFNVNNAKYTLDDLQNSNALESYSEAVLLMMHELVHVKQQRELGLKTFVTNYLVHHIWEKYGFDEFEQEAYIFEAKIAEIIGGEFCKANMVHENDNIQKYNLDLAPLQCLSMYVSPKTYFNDMDLNQNGSHIEISGEHIENADNVLAEFNDNEVVCDGKSLQDCDLDLSNISESGQYEVVITAYTEDFLYEHSVFVDILVEYIPIRVGSIPIIVPKAKLVQ